MTDLPLSQHVVRQLTLDALTTGVLTVCSADGRIVYANQAAGVILGRPPEDLVGSRAEDLFAPVDVQARASGTRVESRWHLRVRATTGAVKDIGFSTTTVKSPVDHTEYDVILFEEITSILELRRERDRLLQIAALGDALPSVLHELRNPIAAVTSLLEVLIEEERPFSEELHAILFEVRKMNLCLQGMTGLTRRLQDANVSAVDYAVREACRVLAPTADRRGVSLRATGPDLPLLPIAATAVSGIVFNLVKNAIDACSSGGTVLVGAAVDGDQFVLTIADDGVGMSPEVRSRCCDLFFTSKESGSGIGLALCKRIVEASNGTMTIDSVPARGTTVTIRIPLLT